MRRSVPVARKHRFSRAFLAIVRFLIVSVVFFIRGIALLITEIIRTHKTEHRQFRSRYRLFRITEHSRRASRPSPAYRTPTPQWQQTTPSLLRQSSSATPRPSYRVLSQVIASAMTRRAGAAPVCRMAGGATVRHGAAQRRQTRAQRGSDLIENT